MMMVLWLFFISLPLVAVSQLVERPMHQEVPDHMPGLQGPYRRQLMEMFLPCPAPSSLSQININMYF